MKILTKSIAAGAFIAIAATIFLNCPITVIGAFLFALGLIMVFEYNAKLFTGYVGSARSLKDWVTSAYVFFGNLIGCFAIMLINGTPAMDLWDKKLITPLWLLFGKALMCGAIIEFCVHQNKNHRKLTSILSCLIAIPGFILGGAEHSIADICYAISRRDFSLKSCAVIGVVALGNVLGAQLLNRLEQIDKK